MATSISAAILMHGTKTAESSAARNVMAANAKAERTRPANAASGSEDPSQAGG